MRRIQVAPKNVQNVNLQFLEEFDYETSNFTQLFTSQLAYHLAYAMHSNNFARQFQTDKCLKIVTVRIRFQHAKVSITMSQQVIQC